MKTPAKNWQKAFFRREIFSPGMSEAAVKAPAEASFVMRALRLKKGQRLLDLCCGTGRHSHALARRGLRVVGLDATPEYLRQARRRRGRDVEFVHGDMRRLSYRSEFDAAINLWTSFGYFLNESDDIRVLKGIAKALKPGGGFIVDVLNGGWLRRHFIPKNWMRRADGAYILEDVSLREGKDPAHFNTWTVLKPGKRPDSASFFVRTYDYDRLARSLRRAGLVPVKAWGGLDGRSYASDGPRLVVLARKRP